MAFSTLGTQWREAVNPVLTNPVLLRIALSHGTSVSSVVLSWALQEGVVVIPRASSTLHLEQNSRMLASYHLASPDLIANKVGITGDSDLLSGERYDPNLVDSQVFLTADDMIDIRSLDGSKEDW